MKQRNQIFWLQSLFAMLFASWSIAAQDDVTVSLRTPYALFDGNEADKINFISDYTFRGGFGGYILADEFHLWQFHAAGHIAIISFNDLGLWRMGLNMEAIADGHLGFRMAQTQYEYFTAIEGILGPGVLYGGYRHQCKHGADTTDTRIIMRSGPELGYNSLFDFGPVRLIWNSSAQIFLAGQNRDIRFHPRAYFTSIAQIEYPLWPIMTLFGSVGMGLIVAAQSLAADTSPCDEKHPNSNCGSYNAFTGIEGVYPNFSPAGALGILWNGKVGEFRLYTSLHSNFDSGFTQVKKDTFLLAVVGEFVL